MNEMALESGRGIEDKCLGGTEIGGLKDRRINSSAEVLGGKYASKCCRRVARIVSVAIGGKPNARRTSSEAVKRVEVSGILA